MKNLIWIFSIILSCLFSCKPKNTDKQQPIDAVLETDSMVEAKGSYYFSGDFKYFADAPSFRDCITGATWNVAMKGIYKKIEKEYTKLDLHDPEGVYCEIMGYLIDKPADAEGPAQQLVITSLIKFDRTAACHMGEVTHVEYQTFIPDKKDATQQVSLILLPDYTFKAVTTNLKDKSTLQSVEGKWRRTSDENIVLLTNGEVYYQGIIDMTDMDLKLYDDNQKLWDFKQQLPPTKQIAD